MSAPRSLIWLLLLLALAQTVWYYPQLPETVASHFDGSGRPNDWSSKRSFFALYLVIVAGVASIFLNVGSLVEKRSRLRLPHRDYWLAPERREQTVSFLSRNLLWAGAASLALAVVVMQLAIEANYESPPRISNTVYWVLLLYFLYVGVWLLRLLVRFRKPAR